MSKSDEAILRAHRELARRTIDVDASFTYDDPELGVVTRVVAGPSCLESDLIEMYPDSGCQAVAWEYEDLSLDRLAITPRRALELLNVHASTYAPIRLWSPSACGRTLDVISLLDRAERDLRVNRSDLNRLSLHDFSRLIDLWNRRDRPEAGAEAIALRDWMKANPDQPGSCVMVRALVAIAPETRVDYNLIEKRAEGPVSAPDAPVPPAVEARPESSTTAADNAPPPVDTDRAIRGTSGIDPAEMMMREHPRAGIKIAFLQYMRDRTSASYQDLIDSVHGNGQTSEDAIRQNATRVNEFLAEKSCPISFRCGSGYVTKIESPG